VSAALQESARISEAEALRVITRALRFVGPFRRKFAFKTLLLVLSIAPLLLLPWPIRIILDHVIGGIPLGEQVTPFPFFVQPLVEALAAASASPSEILAWAIGAQLVLLVLIGAMGTSFRETDEADAWLSSGQDTATRTENEANAGFSQVGGLFGLFDFRFTMGLTQAFNHHYRSRLFERIQTLPMTAFDDERIGDAVYRVMYDTPSITQTCYRLILTPIAAPLTILATVFVMWTVYGWSPIIVSGVAAIPIALVCTLLLGGRIRSSAGQSRQAGATTTSTVEEGITNILAVQSLGGEGRERRRFDRDSAESFQKFRVFVLMRMLALGIGVALGSFVVVWLFFHVGEAIVDEKLTIGDFGVLLPYFVVILVASISLGSVWIRIQENAAGLHRVFFLMDLPAEEDPAGAHTLPEVREGLRVEHASFAYEDGTPALRDVSFEARIGQVTAFVGPAGAGKTTLAYLVPRFLEPTQGRVLLDDVDVANATRESLRSQISFVFQETVLFDATVEQNIRLGNPRASESEVRRAARIAGADEFIQRLPQGYATPLGRGGGKLSVGQKQRLSIARALVRSAPILILDEPTSALDPDTEQRLVAALREASRTRIVIVIAHRLSTVREADQILFIESGAIRERGRHAELLAREGGAYRRFVELQTLGAA
jgi:ABC-type multidrug transport system fused ATPase/permease subunit